jgi:8-oxo-dGTP pyrophosphatase MutT (NUDIX family)
MTQEHWPALRLARECGGPPRVPFLLPADGGGPARVLGSVAVRDVVLLRAWPDAFGIEVDAGGAPSAVVLALAPGGRDARLAQVHAALREAGAIIGWRDEPYPLRDRDGGEHATIERAASRFWGTMTLGAHCNGYVVDASGRPAWLWIARRSLTKQTDPGRLDNLIGGGVPRGQSPREAVVREGWEEAGLEPAQMAGLEEGRVIELDADLPEGRQHERLFVFDLALPPGLVPRNVDGEVAEHRLMPVSEALARAAAGELTTDAALVTLDFALRRGLLATDVEPARAGAESTLRRAFEALLRPAVAIDGRSVIRGTGR